MLDTVFSNVVRDRACHLLTLLGDAGVGKSRLMLEFTVRGLAARRNGLAWPLPALR